jgi:hypothetical protein
MTFVPTEELSQPHAIAQRRATTRNIVATLVEADSALDVQMIVERTGEHVHMVRGILREIVGEWVVEPRDWWFTTPDGWVVDGETESVWHTDHTCQHLWTFDVRAGDSREKPECRECTDCEREVVGGVRHISEVAADD